MWVIVAVVSIPRLLYLSRSRCSRYLFQPCHPIKGAATMTKNTQLSIAWNLGDQRCPGRVHHCHSTLSLPTLLSVLTPNTCSANPWIGARSVPQFEFYANRPVDHPMEKRTP